MSNMKNLFFELVEEDLIWNVHRLHHSNPIACPSCQFCRNQLEAMNEQLPTYAEMVSVDPQAYGAEGVEVSDGE